MKIPEKIYRLRTEHEMTQLQFGQIAGASDKAVSTWEQGKKEPRMKSIQRICDHFDIPINLFVDEDSDIYKKDDIPVSRLEHLPANILPLPKTYDVPLIGDIACGKPIVAIENAGEFVPVPEKLHVDFALRCKGDSMITARIFDGDIVYIKQQPEVENGEIAAVRIGDEATLKKVYYSKDNARITLRACNPLYPDLVYEGELLNDIDILGLAVGFYSKVRHDG